MKKIKSFEWLQVQKIALHSHQWCKTVKDWVLIGLLGGQDMKSAGTTGISRLWTSTFTSAPSPWTFSWTKLEADIGLYMFAYRSTREPEGTSDRWPRSVCSGYRTGQRTRPRPGSTAEPPCRTPCCCFPGQSTQGWASTSDLHSEWN